MPDSTISGLDAASTIADGNVIPVVQTPGAGPKGATALQLKTHILKDPPVTGTITTTTDSTVSSFTQKVDNSAKWANAMLFTESFQNFPGANDQVGVPDNDAFGVAKLSPNLCYTFGWNFQSGGGRLDAAKSAFGITFESNYFTNTARGMIRGFEGHWKMQGPTGIEHRPITMWVPHDGGSGSGLSFCVDHFNFNKFDPLASDVNRIQMDFSIANVTQITFNQPAVIQFPNNNQAFQWRNAAGDGTIQGPYVGSNDALTFSTAFYAFPGKLDPNNAMFTLSGAALPSNIMPANGIGINITSSVAAASTANPIKAHFSTTGISDLTNWNLGGGASYLSAWVAVGGGDAASYYNVNGGGKWYAGLDNSDDDAYAISSDVLGSANALRLDRTTLQTNFGGPAKLKSYTVATLPSASTAGAGALVYVSDASGGPTIACSNGTDWKVVAVLGATVS